MTSKQEAKKYGKTLKKLDKMEIQQQINKSYNTKDHNDI